MIGTTFASPLVLSEILRVFIISAVDKLADSRSNKWAPGFIFTDLI